MFRHQALIDIDIYDAVLFGNEQDDSRSWIDFLLDADDSVYKAPHHCSDEEPCA